MIRAKDDPGLSEEESDAIERWRKLIMSVAIEEMGHLVIVSNLTAALGARPHFDRPNFPVTSGYFPAGITLKLTPFSLDTLDHFIFLERPLGVDLPDGDGFEAPPSARAQAVLGLMPNAQDYTTVSHLYEAIRANLEALSNRVGAKYVFIGAASAQIGGDALKMKGVSAITHLDEAYAALDLIIEQGEGAAKASEDCHFQRFSQIRDEYEALLRDNPGFTPAYPVASNPVMRQPAQGEDKTWVNHPDAAQVLDLSNAIYNCLLRVLVQTYGQNRGREGQGRFIDLAVALMHAMAIAVGELVKMPVSPDAGRTAGMSFTTLRGLQPFAPGDIEESLIVERLAQLRRASDALRQTSPKLQGVCDVLSAAKATFERSASA